MKIGGGVYYNISEFKFQILEVFACNEEGDLKSKADVTEKRESRGMKRKILMKRLLAVTLATSLVISGTPIRVSAADETPEQIVQDTAENVEQPTEGVTDENAGDNSIQETEETQSTNESQQNVEIPETEPQQEIQTPEAGNTVEKCGKCRACYYFKGK